VEVAIKGIWTSLLVNLAPALKQIADAFVEIWVGVRPVVDIIGKVVAFSFKTVVGWLVEIADLLKGIAIAGGIVLGGMLAWGVIAGVVAGITTAFAGMNAAMAAGAAGAGMLRAALIKTGIGAAVVALGALISKMSDGKKKLEPLDVGRLVDEGGVESTLELLREQDAQLRETLNGDAASGLRGFWNGARGWFGGGELAAARDQLEQINEQPLVPQMQIDDQMQAFLWAQLQQNNPNAVQQINNAAQLAGLAEWDAAIQRSFATIEANNPLSELTNKLADLNEELMAGGLSWDDYITAVERIGGVVGPMQKLQEELDKIDMLVAAGLGEDQALLMQNQALLAAERGAGLGGEQRFAAAQFRGSSSAIESILRHQASPQGALSVQERIERLQEQNNRVQQQQLQALRAIENQPAIEFDEV
jgi:hypothetical protein